MTKQGAIDYFVSRKENGERLLSNKCHGAEDWAIKALKDYPEWVSVKDRLPPEHDSIFAKVYGTKQWNPNMFQRSSDDVRVAVRFEDGTRMVTHDKTIDGKWCSEKDKAAYPKRTVTHWMKNPELPEEET